MNEIIIKNIPQLRKDIGDALATKVNKMFEKIAKEANKLVLDFLWIKLTESKTYKSLTGDDGVGVLRGDFGLTDAAVSQLRDNLDYLYEVTYSLYNPKTSKQFGLQDKVLIEIRATEENSEFFTFISENGYSVNWMTWLLQEGSSPVVTGYHVFPKAGIGRSKLAIMIKDDSSDFSVKSHFSGTIEDNWITRTIIRHRKEIEDIIRDHVKKNR